MGWVALSLCPLENGVELPSSTIVPKKIKYQTLIENDKNCKGRREALPRSCPSFVFPIVPYQALIANLLMLPSSSYIPCHYPLRSSN